MEQLYHYTVDGFVEGIYDIDDMFEGFLSNASCHFNPTLMHGTDEECDDLPF